MAAKSAGSKPATRKASESVDTFLEALEHPSKEEFILLRQIILGADPRISEGIKWNAPSFHIASEYFATLHLRAKKGVPVILWEVKSQKAKVKNKRQGDWMSDLCLHWEFVLHAANG